MSTADKHCVKRYQVLYMITFLKCLVSLMMAPYTSAETCCSKTSEHKKYCYD